MANASSAKGVQAGRAKDYKRIAVIGHSFSDGGTWSYLVRQALVEAGRPEPILINAAAGGDVAGDNLRRLDWAVLQYKPDLAIILTSSHNVKKMTQDEFRAAMEEMITKLQANGSTVLLLHGYLKCPEGMQPADMKDANRVKQLVDSAPQELVHQRNGDDQTQCDLAAKYNCLIADLRPYLLDAFGKGQWLWEPDRSHLSYEGYRAVARAVLDVLDHKSLPVPQTMKVKVLPGLVTPLMIRAAKDKEPSLDANSILAVKPDSTWTTYMLPEKEPIGSWWPDQVRQEGYVMSLEKALGKADHYVGCATVKSGKAANAYINVSGGLKSVWLNGKPVYKYTEWNGFHAGAERVAVQLHAGDNTIIFESSAQFALTVTPEALW